MPSDLLGVSVYERGKDAFIFPPGPVFAPVLPADEIEGLVPRLRGGVIKVVEGLERFA